jgi:hypothetical protein
VRDDRDEWRRNAMPLPPPRAVLGRTAANGGASFTIGGFCRGCEKIGGHIGQTYASRNGVAPAGARYFGIRPRASRVRRSIRVSRGPAARSRATSGGGAPLNAIRAPSPAPGVPPSLPAGDFRASVAFYPACGA